MPAPVTLLDIENENRQLRQQLDETRAALQDFIYAVSHDLGAPLRAVAGFTSILQHKYAAALDDKGRDYLRFVSEGGGTAQQMLAGLLSYSRVQTQSTPSAPIDLNAVIEHVRCALEDKISTSGADIASESLPVVWGDHNQINQLLTALIDNALTYRRPGVAPRIVVTVDEASDFWRFGVVDNGLGLDPRQAPRAFQVFKRLHANDALAEGAHAGIGMGLPIARRIVERHRGTIGIASPGAAAHGSEIWFTLPKHASEVVELIPLKEVGNV